MSPTSRFVRPALVPALLSLLFAFGCNSKGDSSNPVNPGDTSSGSDFDDISLSATGALGFVNEFVSEVDALSQGDFSTVPLDVWATASAAAPLPPGVTFFEDFVDNRGGNADLGRSADQVLWNEPEQTWEADVTVTDTSAEGTASASVYFAVQYLDGSGTPQYLPDETTTTMSVETIVAIDLSGQSDGQVFDLSLDYEMAMTVGGLQTGPFAIDGTGALDMAMLWTGAGPDNIDVALGMDWDMDLSVPADGSCPTGAVTMSAEATDHPSMSFVGTYNGTSTASWTLSEAGTVVDSGTEAIDCNVPAA